MRKRMIQMVAAITIATVGITGCGGSNDNQATTAKSEATKNETAKDETVKDEATKDEAANETDKEATKEATGEDVKEVAGWTFTFEDKLVDSSLANAKSVLGYGEVETSNFEKKAADGNVFCLVKLKIKKNSSSETISWKNMKLKDNNGAEYSRVEDEFISDLGMKRLPGTDLNFGENEGWICFEVDENATSFTLEYPFESETYQIEFSK